MNLNKPLNDLNKFVYNIWRDNKLKLQNDIVYKKYFNIRMKSYVSRLLPLSNKIDLKCTIHSFVS